MSSYKESVIQIKFCYQKLYCFTVAVPKNIMMITGIINLFTLVCLNLFTQMLGQQVCNIGGQCNPPKLTPSSNCGAFLGWRPLGISEVDIDEIIPKAIHQSFLYDDQWLTENVPTIPNSITYNSGYYCFKNNTSNDRCSVGLSGTGRVCSDKPENRAKYRFTTSSDQLTSSQCAAFAFDPSKYSLFCNNLQIAENAVAAFWNQCKNANAASYNIRTHNCQAYATQVMNAYCSQFPSCLADCPNAKTSLPNIFTNIHQITSGPWKLKKQ